MKHGGSGLLLRYHNSLIKALKAIYPDVEWKEFLFRHVPRSYWKEKRHHQDYMEWLGKQLNVQKMDDWYAVGSNTVLKRKGGSILQYQIFPGMFV